jgi:hypothetical protein
MSDTLVVDPERDEAAYALESCPPIFHADRDLLDWIEGNTFGVFVGRTIYSINITDNHSARYEQYLMTISTSHQDIEFDIRKSREGFKLFGHLVGENRVRIPIHGFNTERYPIGFLLAALLYVLKPSQFSIVIRPHPGSLRTGWAAGFLYEGIFHDDQAPFAAEQMNACFDAMSDPRVNDFSFSTRGQARSATLVNFTSPDWPH